MDFRNYCSEFVRDPNEFGRRCRDSEIPQADERANFPRRFGSPRKAGIDVRDLMIYLNQSGDNLQR